MGRSWSSVLHISVSSAGEGSLHYRDSVKMEDGELDWYSLDTSDKVDELVEASTEVSSNLNIYYWMKSMLTSWWN